jgi:4-hydroxy-tetrahydrodipicolinate reductase
MYISIIGYGRMGRLVEEVAKQKNITIISTIDPNGTARYNEITKESIGNADVCICFTQASDIVETIGKVVELKKNIVVGTTGWDDYIPDIKELVEKAGVGMVYSPNFAFGVNIFFKIIEEAALIVDKFDNYDVAIHEMHHRGKIDSPSGTANTIGKIILDNMKQKNTIEDQKIERQISEDELHISSSRCGCVPGYHTVYFDSEEDTIQLTHTARSRKGFAVGAIIAAEWIKGRVGYFTKDDVLKGLFEVSNK